MITTIPLLALLSSCATKEKSEQPLSPTYETVANTVMSVHQPVHYARLREASPEQNFAGQPLYLGASADGIEVALVQYNPERFAGMNVEKAVLQFSAGQTCHSSYVVTYPKCGNDLTIEAHVVEFPWEQQHVTWASFHEHAEPYHSDVLGTALLHVPEGEHRQYTIDVTAAVQGWISGKENYGFALVPDEKGQRKGRLTQTDTVLNYAPELVVHAR